MLIIFFARVFIFPFTICLRGLFAVRHVSIEFESEKIIIPEKN